MKWTIELETDENGELILPLGEEICAEAGWSVGDTIKWIDNGDGTWTLRKVDEGNQDSQVQ